MRSNLAHTKWLLFSIYISFISILSCTDHEADFQSDELDHWEQYTTADGLAEEVSKVLFIDSRERIWIGTENKGVSVYDGHTFQNYDSTNGLVNNNVNAITEDRTNNLIWIGTEGGLSIIDVNDNWESISEIEGESITVYSLFADANDAIWLGTFPYGLLRFTFEDGFLQHFDDECSDCNYVNAILQTYDGAMWFGTDGGLKRMENNKYQLFTSNEGLPDNTVLSLYEDSWENLWIGTFEGSYVAYYDGIQFRPVPLKNGSAVNVIFSFCESEDGLIWIGSYKNGLLFYDGAVTRTLNPNQDPGNIGVYDIVKDKAGNLWVGTPYNYLWKYITP